MPTLRASKIFSDAGHLVIAVESVDLQHGRTLAGSQLYSRIDPIAVVVCSRDKTYAVDMAGKPTDIEQLKQTVPELETMIGPFGN